MPTTDKRIDAYIAKQPDWAQEILTRVRELVHEAVPDIEETIKWGVPNYLSNGIVVATAGTKNHCIINFWKAPLLGLAEPLNKVTSVKELPPKKVMIGYLKKAAALNATGEKVPKIAKKKPELVAPNEFLAAIKKNKKAAAVYENFSPSHRREYIEWITQAKGEDTRARRIAQAVQWMADGKARNWKYM